MDEIHFQVDGGGGHIWLVISLVEDVAKSHGGSLIEGRPSETGKKFRVIAPDEKLPLIQKELGVKNLPIGQAWTSDQLACT